MADIKKLFDAIAVAAKVKGHTFDPSRAVLTLEIASKSGKTQGQTIALAYLLEGKDEVALANSIVAGAASHFDKIEKFDPAAAMEENQGLKAKVAQLEAQLSEKQPLEK